MPETKVETPETAQTISTNESDDPKIDPKRDLDQDDLDNIARIVCEDLDARKSSDERVWLEERWKTIDRQVAMEPDPFYKFTAEGQPHPDRGWMTELELPNQAYTQEITTSDIRRLLQPLGGGPGFGAKVVTTDEWLREVEGPNGIKIAGDENDLPSNLSQDMANRLVTGWLHEIHSQNDFWQTMDFIMSETVKYGTGVPRVRPAKKPIFRQTAQGMMRKEVALPVVVARSIRNTYPDDKPEKWKNEGYLVGPSIICEEDYREADLIKAASDGSTDPDKYTGGWLPGQLKGLKSDNGWFKVVEYEGDLLVSRSQPHESLFQPGMIITVVRSGAGADADQRVIRMRFNRYPFTSYGLIPYNPENIATKYSSSPLMKGASLQAGGSLFYNMLACSGLLNVQPPCRFDRDDAVFAATGGPRVMPGARWETLGEVKFEQIGDISELNQSLMIIEQLYEQVTGTPPSRFGAQTVSHTTAFAKNAELVRGESRTVDFARSALSGPINRMLYMEYEIGRDIMGSRTDYVEIDGAFVEIAKRHLPDPDKVKFESFGAGQPADEQARDQKKLASFNMTLQMEQMKMQAEASGQPMSIDITEMQRVVLREGGWTDVDQFFREDSAGGSSLAGPGAGVGNAAPALVTGSDAISPLMAAG